MRRMGKKRQVGHTYRSVAVAIACGAALAALGVARVSAGSGVALAAYAVVRRAARELLDTGTYDAQTGGLGYGELNSLLGQGR